MLMLEIVTLILLLIILILIVLNNPKQILFESKSTLTSTKENIERLMKETKDELSRLRDEISRGFQAQREEISNSINNFNNSILVRLNEAFNAQKQQLDVFTSQLSKLTESNEGKLENIRETVEKKLVFMQEENSKKLEQMRMVVDEKLHETLEKRLGDSFKLVSERLELVHKGLGEMQILAAGVGDLKKVLTNVKVRGTWGEIQLENLLEQVMAPDQYQKNVMTKKGSRDAVEFAIKLPGKEKSGHVVYLPIDSKFPKEDYDRLVDAQEKADAVSAEESSKKIEAKVKAYAKDIRDKYLDPPNTTDFGIMFLPTEGLYAEVIRRAGLVDVLQRENRVIIAGPTTLMALLSSLQMGFRTLAVEKRSSEVWALLGAVKTEFMRFGDILDKTHKKLQEASNTIEDAAKKTRKIEKQLKDVQELPSAEAHEILPESDDVENESDMPF